MQGLSDSKFGIVTYAGKGFMEQPHITVIRGLQVTSNVQRLFDVIERLQFNGTDYIPESTQIALNFVGKYMKRAPSGVHKTVLVVAPEDEVNVS